MLKKNHKHTKRCLKKSSLCKMQKNALIESDISNNNAKLVFYDETGPSYAHIDMGQFEYKTTRKDETTMQDKEKRFVDAGGVLPNANPVKTDVSPEHFKRVLRNAHKTQWSNAFGMILISEMPDQHLINTMRWLMRNANGLRATMHTMVSEMPAFFRTDTLLDPFVTSATFLSKYLPCFDTLAEEVNRRFGNAALRALYDGL